MTSVAWDESKHPRDPGGEGRVPSDTGEQIVQRHRKDIKDAAEIMWAGRAVAASAAQDFNALVAAASDIVWRQEQPLAAVYATVLKAAGRAAASRFVERASHMAIAAAGMFDEAKHPRHPAGTPVGGEFAPKPLGHLGNKWAKEDGLTGPTYRNGAYEIASGKVSGQTHTYTTAWRIRRDGDLVGVASSFDRAKELAHLIDTDTLPTVDTIVERVMSNKYAVDELWGGRPDTFTELRYARSRQNLMAAYEEIPEPDRNGYRNTISATIMRGTQARLKSIVAAAEWHPPQIDELVPASVIGDKARDAAAAEHERILTLIADGFAAGVAWDVTAPLSQKLLDQLGARAEAIADSIREPIARIIANAYLNGLSVPQTAAAIVEGVDGLAGWQATMLARTDLIGLANGGSMLAARLVREADPTALAYKQWLATPDERTRDHHREAHGQVVASGGKFDVGDAALDYPGDPSGPDAEVINCRCTMVWADTPEGLPGVGEISMVAAQYVEAEHPRDPGGEGGGRWIAKGTTAEDDYRGHHEAPDHTNGAPLHDLDGALDDEHAAYPSDVYGPDAARLYGHGGDAVALDRESASIIKRFQGKPDAPVDIFRAVPHDSPNRINPGDWVTINQHYAEYHARSQRPDGDPEWKILHTRVPARQLFTEANSIHEFGWDPTVDSQTAALPFTEALHPRHPRGVREGGRFRDKAIVNEQHVEEDIGKYVDDLTPYMTDPEDILVYTDFLRRRYREVYGPPLQDLTERLHGLDAIIEPEPVPKILGDPSAPQTPTFSVALNTGRPDPPTFTVRYTNDGIEVEDVLDPTDTEWFATLDDAVRYTKLVNASRGLSLRAAMFDESKHPRHPSGTEQGGEFAPKDAPHVGPVVDESGVEEKLRGEVQSLADYFADRPDYAYTPEKIEQETQNLLAEYHRRFDPPQAELLKRLEGIPGVTIVPTVDAEKLALYEGDSAEFMVRVDPGDPTMLTPDVQVWNFPSEGGLQVAEALDLSDTDFFPPDRPDIAGRYADVLDGIRGVKREGYVTLYRQMSDAEAQAWERGDEIPFGKWFARDRNANMGQDIAGEFVDTYAWKVARKDVVETDPGVFQLRRPARLRDGSVTAAGVYDESKHPRDPGGEGGGQWIPKGTTGVDEGETLRPSADLIERIEERWSEDASEGTQPDIIAIRHDMTLDDYKLAVEQRMRDDLESAYVAIRTPVEVVDEIEAEGRFKSQHETGESGGTLDNSMRRFTEGELFGYAEDLPVEERPIYGYMSRPGHEQLESMTHGYGEIKWELKNSARARATFTGGDSFAMQYVPSPVSSPRYWSGAQPVAWTNPEMDSDPLKTGLFRDTVYVEAQVHGGVTLDDVAAVQIPKYLKPIAESGSELPKINPQRQKDDAFHRAIQRLKARGITVEYV